MTIESILEESPLTEAQKRDALAEVLAVVAKWKARLAEEEMHLTLELLHARVLEHGSDLDDIVYDKGGFFAHAQDYHYEGMVGGNLNLEDLATDMHEMQTKFMQDEDA